MKTLRIMVKVLSVCLLLALIYGGPEPLLAQSPQPGACYRVETFGWDSTLDSSVHPSPDLLATEIELTDTLLAGPEWAGEMRVRTRLRPEGGYRFVYWLPIEGGARLGSHPMAPAGFQAVVLTAGGRLEGEIVSGTDAPRPGQAATALGRIRMLPIDCSVPPSRPSHRSWR